MMVANGARPLSARRNANTANNRDHGNDMKVRLVVLITLLFINSCSGLFFYPSKEQLADPAQYGIHPESVSFKSSDGTHLSGWFFKSATKPVKGTIIQFHGNAENMTSHFRSLVWVIAHGYNLFTFDYRGYGTSEGRPTIEGLNMDAVAAYSTVAGHPEASKGPLILYGQSLGGIVLLKAMENFQNRSMVSHVIVEGSFLSYQEIAREKLSHIWLTWPVQHLAYLLLSDQFAAVQSIQQVSPIPLLVIHGRQDPVIPFRFGEAVFDTAKQPKTFWAVENGRHIDAMISNSGKYRRRLIVYLQQ